MIQRIRRAMASVLLLVVTTTTAAGQSAGAAPAVVPSAVAATHAELERRGIGHRVRLVETDGEDRGRIIALAPDTVTLHADTGVDVTVQLTNVVRVRSGGLSHEAKIWVTVAVLIGASVAGAALGLGFHD